MTSWNRKNLLLFFGIAVALLLVKDFLFPSSGALFGLLLSLLWDGWCLFFALLLSRQGNELTLWGKPRALFSLLGAMVVNQLIKFVHSALIGVIKADPSIGILDVLVETALYFLVAFGLLAVLYKVVYGRFLQFHAGFWGWTGGGLVFSLGLRAGLFLWLEQPYYTFLATADSTDVWQYLAEMNRLGQQAALAWDVFYILMLAALGLAFGKGKPATQPAEKIEETVQ